MNLKNTIIVLSLVTIVTCEFDMDSSDIARQRRRRMMRSMWIYDRLRKMIESNTNRNILRSRNKLQPLIDDSWPFPCPKNGSRSSVKPTSVHKLRPGDIDVVGAIGDSLSAGIGLTATNKFEIYFANRGISPSAGGQGTWREYMTLPNILKEFNSNLTGYAEEPAPSKDPKAKFNLAKLGAMSHHIKTMALRLIERIEGSPEVNFKEDWKMITMMIGPNDFCIQICYEDSLENALDKHRQDLIEVFRLFRDRLPRTIVNLVPAPNLKALIDFKKKPVFCQLNHSLVCPCLVRRAHFTRQRDFIEFMSEWQRIEYNVSLLDEFNTDSFTVVFQPFTLEFGIPEDGQGSTDYTYLSEDCFHFSQKMNAIVSNSLWNNLLEPVGHKSTRDALFLEEFRCPTVEHPYIFTKKNSYY